MEQTSFIRQQGDKVESTLQGISEHIITIVFGFLPIIFIPIAFIPLDYGKVTVIIAALALAVIFFSLSILRSGSLKVATPPALIALWAVAGVASLSALFSGDTSDAFLGDLIEVNTAVFLLLLAFIGSLSSLVRLNKMSIMRLYIYLTGSAALLGVFHVSRVVFGPDFLSLGLFTSSVSTTVGSWNDLGLFFGLSILLSMVALEQLPLTKWGRIVFSIGILLSLAMLSVINFSAVWWILGLVSLVMLMYGLVRDRFSDSLAVGEKSVSSLQSILLSLGVFIVSLMFIVAGGPLGGMISEATNISYLEVRPSFTATTDIARSVYSENAFFGAGPNKFVDAWRQYKDPSINQTIFWNTDFRGGNGYVTTFLVTTGILGTLAWLAFFGLFLYTGFKMLFKTVHADKFWYFIGSSSFVAAIYLWGMSLIYLPGTVVLILAALFTTITFAAYAEMVGVGGISLSVKQNKRAAVLLVGVVMIVVIGSASTMYFVGRHFSAIYTYAKTITSVAPGVNLSDVEQGVANAFAIYPNDTYARQVANYQLAKINSLLSLTEPTTEQQQEFQNAVINGINSAQRAVELDSTDAVNWSVLGAVYSILVAAGETEVISRAEDALANARKYAPSNPSYILQEAQLQIRAGNVERGRELISEALALKPNYTDALNFLTELDVASGRVDEAIATTRSIINLEPNNPARHYQLAILLSTKNDIDGTISSLERAVALNPSYANARYLLALAYAQEGRMQDAIEQLVVVQGLNPNNQVVADLISQMQSGEYVPTAPPTTSSVSEPEPVVDEDNVVTSPEVPDTPLLSPVNAVDTPDEPEPTVDEPETPAPTDDDAQPSEPATEEDPQQ